MEPSAQALSLMQPSGFALAAGPDFRAGALDRLPEAEAERLLAGARRIRLSQRQVLCHGELSMDYVYLIETGLVSAMAKADKNRWVEAFMVGSGGLAGLPPLLADGRSANRIVTQIGGAALCIPARDFRRLLEASHHARTIALENLAYLLLQASQIAACNAQHSAIERVTRWLLLASHELGAPRLPVSHDSVARAIGLRRATVSDCLKQLEARGAIKTNRRLIEIAETNALQSCSCDCYRIISRGRQRHMHLA